MGKRSNKPHAYHTHFVLMGIISLSSIVFGLMIVYIRRRKVFMERYIKDTDYYFSMAPESINSPTYWLNTKQLSRCVENEYMMRFSMRYDKPVK